MTLKGLKQRPQCLKQVSTAERVLVWQSDLEQGNYQSPGMASLFINCEFELNEHSGFLQH